MQQTDQSKSGVAENPDRMSVAIEFRMKPILQQSKHNGNGGDNGGGSFGESKAFKQLRQDCQQLANEHPGQVCFSTDAEVIEHAAHYLFRTVGFEDGDSEDKEEEGVAEFDELDERDVEGFQHDLL